ncbi:MAG: TIGR00296 family protein [Candidatus Thermoplasmatota archaeon]|nr:TIGR00296 family protein [Candidatus Thermoplasmatota archaeon]
MRFLILSLMLSLEDGTKAVQFARHVIQIYLQRKNQVSVDLGSLFHEKQGVFVTLHTYPDHDLRGCIGIPLPVMSLQDAIRESAQSVTRDPRFPPLQETELDAIIVELTVLTKPERIQVQHPNEYPAHIDIGRDGLIVEQGYFKGLLLPQVPVEQAWDKQEYLSHTCMKAGLPPDAWFDKSTKISKFQGQIFTETAPRGPIQETHLHGSDN